MPKQLDYPRATFKNALSLADAVNSLGGDCNAGTCADKLDYKGGHKNGAFNALASATVKHSLITSKSEVLTVTDLYRQISLSYSEAEKQEYMQIAFLSPPLYHKIYEKFKGRELPVDTLERMLIREYEVDQGAASRVVGYITEGAKFVGLLIENRFVEHIKAQDAVIIKPEKDQLKKAESNRLSSSNSDVVIYQDIPHSTHSTQDKKEFNGDGYMLTIIGPDMNSTYKVQEEDDFTIIEAILRKLKRKLGVV